MSFLGEAQIVERKELFTTKHFYKFLVCGVNIDVMSGFGIKHEVGEYSYVLDEFAISDIIKTSGTNIPLASLEDWFVIYQLLPNKEYKADLIENYLREKGIKNYNLLSRSLKNCLPKSVTDRVNRLISK